jgi:AspT/YidE/YbjL antiporter-like protein
MEFMQEFFTSQSIASTILFLCMTAFTGVMIGKLEVKSVRIGVAGVLFSGIFIAHCGAPVDVHMLHFVRDFGLILFVYSIGLNMGPRFFSSFRKDGLLLNLLAIGIALGGFGIACLIYFVTDLSPAVIVGILCGAVTNTPSLGAAQQALAEQGVAERIVSETGMAYAVAYPFGVVGIIISILLIRLFFKINTNAEVKNYTEALGSSEAKLQSVEITVVNPGLFGKSIEFVKLTPGANLFMREFGIILFLSSVGLLSGEKFVETILSGGWQWMLYGIAITFVPIMAAGITGRLLNVNYLKICGCLSGSMTDPPALEFANSIAPVQAQATAYATVYPLTMFLRVLLAQIFVLMTL